MPNMEIARRLRGEPCAHFAHLCPLEDPLVVSVLLLEVDERVES